MENEKIKFTIFFSPSARLSMVGYKSTVTQKLIHAQKKTREYKNPIQNMRIFWDVQKKFTWKLWTKTSNNSKNKKRNFFSH